MAKLTELTVVFRTQSDVEASVVRGLLESEGFQALLSVIAICSLHQYEL